MEEKKESSYEKILQLKRKMWNTIILLLAGIFVLLFTTVAWFVNNKKIAADGVRIETGRPDEIHIIDTVTAARTYLSYEKEDFHVIMTRKEDGSLIVTDPEDYADTGVAVLFDQMLPGEWVDITFDVEMDASLHGQLYSIYLADLEIGEKPKTLEEAKTSTGWFALDADTKDQTEKSCFHNILGVYTYQVRDVSRKDTQETLLEDTKAPKYLGTYRANEDDDEAPDQLELFRGVWDQEYGTISVTLRIAADFNQFYNLLKETGSDISNLLSQKGFVVNKIGVGVAKQ